MRQYFQLNSLSIFSLLSFFCHQMLKDFSNFFVFLFISMKFCKLNHQWKRNIDKSKCYKYDNKYEMKWNHLKKMMQKIEDWKNIELTKDVKNVCKLQCKNLIMTRYFLDVLRLWNFVNKSSTSSRRMRAICHVDFLYSFHFTTYLSSSPRFFCFTIFSIIYCSFSSMTMRSMIVKKNICWKRFFLVYSRWIMIIIEWILKV